MRADTSLAVTHMKSVKTTATRTRRTGWLREECSPCSPQGPLSAITQNNGDSTMLADCAKYCSSLTQEEAERLSRRGEASPSCFCSSLLSLRRLRRQETRRTAGLCLADLRPIAGFAAHQMREEAGVSKSCECQ